MKKEVSIIIMWGAIWGIVEASLGYVLHRVTLGIPGLAGFIMFPVACYFMNKVYKQTGKTSSILSVSFITAAIKLTDFLIPRSSTILIINPAIAIILEGIVIYAAFRIWEMKKNSLNYILLPLVASMGWRLLFCLYLLMLPSYIAKAPMVTSMESFLKFIILEGFINSIIIYIYLKVIGTIGQKLKVSNMGYNLVISLSFLVLALFVQWVI